MQMTGRDLSPSRRRRDTTLSFSGVNSDVNALSWGIHQEPHPCPAPPEKNSIQPLSRRSVPEPKLCIEVSLTSRTSSGSLPTREVTFHVPEDIFIQPGIGPPWPLSLTATRSTMHHGFSRRWWTHMTMVLLFRARYGFAPRTKAQPPGICSQAPPPGLAPGWGPGVPSPGEGNGNHGVSSVRVF